MMWAWAELDRGLVRMILGFNVFIKIVRKFLGLKIDWWYLKIWSFESRFSMRLTSLGILSTLVVTKCTKI